MNYQCLPNEFQVIYENPVSSTPLTSLYVIPTEIMVEECLRL
jgi:hypothetical protein